MKSTTTAQEGGSAAGSTTSQLAGLPRNGVLGQPYAAPATSPEQHYQRQTDTTGVRPHQTAFQPDRPNHPSPPSRLSPAMVGATNGHGAATSSSSPPSQYPPQSSSDLTASSSSSSSPSSGNIIAPRDEQPRPPPEGVPPAPSTSSFFRPTSRTTSRFAHVPEVEIESRSQSALEGAVVGSATYAPDVRDENNTFERLTQPVSTTSRGERLLPTPGAQQQQQQVGDPGAPFAARSGGQQQTNFYGGGSSVYNISQSATATPAGAAGTGSRFDFAQMITTSGGGTTTPGGFVASGRAATTTGAAVLPATAASTSFNIDPVQYPATQIKPTGGAKNRNNVSYPLHQHHGATPTTGSSRQTPSGIQRKKPIHMNFLHDKHRTLCMFCMTNWMWMVFFLWISGTSTGRTTLLHHQQQLDQVVGVGGTTNANNMEMHLRQGGNNASGSSSLFVPHSSNYPQDHPPPGGVAAATAPPPPLQVVQQHLQQPQPQMIQANFGQQPHLQANLGAFYAQHQMQINIPTSTPGSTPQLVPTPSATPNSTSSARARPGILRNTSSTPPLNVVNHYNQQQHGGSGGGANIAESSSRVGGNAATLYNSNPGAAGGRSSGYGAAPGSMTGSASHQPSSASTPTNNFHQMQKRFPDSLKAKALGMNQQHAGNMAGVNVNVSTNNNTGMMSTSGGGIIVSGSSSSISPSKNHRGHLHGGGSSGQHLSGRRKSMDHF